MTAAAVDLLPFIAAAANAESDIGVFRPNRKRHFVLLECVSLNSSDYFHSKHFCLGAGGHQEVKKEPHI